MKATITIQCDNAAFDPEGDGDQAALGAEIARILRGLADDAENGSRCRSLYDCNGNKVGKFLLE